MEEGPINLSPVRTPDWMRVEEPVKRDVKESEQTQETKEKELPKIALTPREELINDITKAGYTVIEAIEQIEEMEGKKTPPGKGKSYT